PRPANRKTTQQSRPQLPGGQPPRKPPAPPPPASDIPARAYPPYPPPTRNRPPTDPARKPPDPPPPQSRSPAAAGRRKRLWSRYRPARWLSAVRRTAETPPRVAAACSPPPFP